MKKLLIPILFLISCTNQTKTDDLSYEMEVLKLDVELQHKLDLIDYFSMNGGRYDYDSVKTYRAYQADSLGLSPDEKIKYINQ